MDKEKIRFIVVWLNNGLISFIAVRTMHFCSCPALAVFYKKGRIIRKQRGKRFGYKKYYF